jgi:hypothetical protein
MPLITGSPNVHAPFTVMYGVAVLVKGEALPAAWVILVGPVPSS